MATFWEMTAYSFHFVILIISHFGFEDRILILIVMFMVTAYFLHSNLFYFSSVSNAYIHVCNSYYFCVCCFYVDAFTIDHVVIL